MLRCVVKKINTRNCLIKNMRTSSQNLFFAVRFGTCGVYYNRLRHNMTRTYMPS